MRYRQQMSLVLDEGKRGSYEANAHHKHRFRWEDADT
jgi:hypothetical protein